MTKSPNIPTFAFNLLQQMGTKGQNVFFSPYSIKACMALLYEGARGINPQEYLTDVLSRLPSMKNRAVEDVLPSRWKPNPPGPP